MKKIKSTKKLSLSKKTIASLGKIQMGNVKGGSGATHVCATCATDSLPNTTCPC